MAVMMDGGQTEAVAGIHEADVASGGRVRQRRPILMAADSLSRWHRDCYGTASLSP